MGGRNATSTVRVNIIGDAKSLQAAVGTADKSIAGLGASAKGLLAGAAFAAGTAAVIDFGSTALGEADRVGDALTRLEGQIGSDLTAALDDAADGFHDLGQSRQDILELEAAFADFATAIGLSDADIATFADDVAVAAAKLALIDADGRDAATIVDLIGKSAAGNERAMRELGINLDDAAVEARALADSGKDTPDMLTDSDRAAAGYAIVLEQLAPKLALVADKTGDVEQSSANLQAKWETLTGKVGEMLEGPLNDFLTWTINGIGGLEDLGELMEKSPKFVDIMGSAFDNLTAGPLDSMLDTVHDILDAIGLVNRTPLTVKYQSTPNPDRRDRDFEASVVGALRDYARRNGLTIL